MPDDGEPREADDGQEKLPAGPEDEPQDADSNTGPEDALDVDDGDEPGERSAAESDPSVDDTAATAEDGANENGVRDGEDGSIVDASDGADESADEGGDDTDEAEDDDGAEDDVEVGADEPAAGDDVDDDIRVAEDEPAEDDVDDADEELSPDTDADGDDDPSATAVGNGGVESGGFGGISTPPDDEEMPLADHIEEMISRLAIVLLIGAAGTALGILWAADAIDIIWSDAIPEADEWPPHLYHPLELWLTRIKVAGLLGIMVALPMFVYQCYRFMRPGLYPHERKYYLAAVPTSVVLAGVGMLF